MSVERVVRLLPFEGEAGLVRFVVSGLVVVDFPSGRFVHLFDIKPALVEYGIAFEAFFDHARHNFFLLDPSGAAVVLFRYEFVKRFERCVRETLLLLGSHFAGLNWPDFCHFGSPSVRMNAYRRA